MNPVQIIVMITDLIQDGRSLEQITAALGEHAAATDLVACIIALCAEEEEVKLGWTTTATPRGGRKRKAAKKAE